MYRAGGMGQWRRRNCRRALGGMYQRWPEFDTIAEFFPRYVVANQLNKIAISDLRIYLRLVLADQEEPIIQVQQSIKRKWFFAWSFWLQPPIGFSGVGLPTANIN